LAQSNRPDLNALAEHQAVLPTIGTYTRDILEQVVSGNVEAVTSALTWDEFVYVVSRALGRDIAVAEGEKFLRFPNLQFAVTDVSVLAKAQSVIAATALRPRDAIHAATAILAGAIDFVSDDDDFDVVPELNRTGVLS